MAQSDLGEAARVMTADDGSRWIAKSHVFGGQTHRYLALNEALCAQVALRIGVQVPEAAIGELSDEQLAAIAPTAPTSARQVFASRVVDGAEALSPEAASASSVSQMAGIIVLDALVWNTDRKEEHVLTQPLGDGTFTLWAIDHGHTLATADSLAGVLNVDQPPVAPPSLLADRVTTADLEPWVDAAQAITKREFASMVEPLPPAWVVEPDAAESLSHALYGRARVLRDHLASLVGSSG